ncbi:hypothetical protein TNIN_330661 [Trichonephila inaurata madagascariensis]|uniref:Uncharacterized protein n=1 Tax=Trichonephila inaurata madagascariensis TaxID=2747483 RepID=A0A8X7CQ50_9ARAC|nr:hypothetical protein TNIN_330661 [Trichonephila inaurata madagascariensis]
MFQPTTTSGNVDGFANSSVLQTPLTPLRGERYSRKYRLPLLIAVVFHTLAALDALTAHCLTRSRMCVGHSDTHSILYGQKGVPVTERPLEC